MPTHFYRIVTGHSLHEGKLMIPRAFVEKYGEGLPKTIFLKPPNGAEWKFDLVKSDGEIWFQEGWKEFAEHHSLAHGHLLLFTYGGTSDFQLHIFAMNALEINYPVKGERAFNGKGKKPESDENSEDCKAGRKRKANLSLELFQPCKMGSGGCVKAGNDFKLQKAESPHIDKMCKGKQVITAKQVTALDRASSFKTHNPSFLIFMHPSYICGQMNLPLKFCVRHLDLSKRKGVINLRVVNGRVWTTKYLICRTKRRMKILLLSSGWRVFVKDNNLKVGDVCSFELIVRTNNTFLVHIFRETDNANCSTFKDLKAGQKRKDNLSSESLQSCKIGRSCVKVGNNALKLQKGASCSTDKRCQGKQVIAAKQVITALDRASSFKTFNPSFLIFMHPSYVTRGEMNLPAKFFLKHLDLRKPKGDINLGVVNGRVWTVNYLIRKFNRRKKIVLLSSGWRVFVKDNNLKVGDVCTFELIVCTNNTFQVHIFRESDNANSPTSQESVKVEELVKD